MDLKEEALLGGDASKHWYYRSKLAALRLAISGLPPMPVLDVGAGSGFFSRALLTGGEASEATCIDPGYASDSDQQVNGRTLRFRRVPERSDAGLVLMMDVLEHVPDDAALLADYVAQVPAGARVMVTVPAFQALWSGHDVFLEHYRRYTLHQVERLLQNAGLQVELGCYFFAALLPLVAAARLGKRLLGSGPPASDMGRVGPLADAAFGAICRAELAVFRANRLAGVSVFARAVKP
jgi:hypothetical protein